MRPPMKKEHRFLDWNVLAFLAATLWSAVTPALQAQIEYTLQNLGTLGGINQGNGIGSQPGGVNASGQVAGGSFTASGQFHAFLSGPNGGALIDLGTPPGEIR